MAGEPGARWGWGASWWDHVGHPGTGIPITHSMGTVHTLTPPVGSAGRVGAMGCSGHGLLCRGLLCHGHRGPAPPPASKASHREMWGKGSTIRARELQRVVGQAPAKITPPIFLLQELRDKRDLQDLPAIQIEYLILAAGEERGLSPRGTWRCAGGGFRGCPASRGGISSTQGKTDARADTRDRAAPCWWDRTPSAQPAPNPTSRSPAANCAAQSPLPRGSSCRIVPGQTTCVAPVPGMLRGGLRSGPGPRMLPMGQPGANARLLLASLYFSPALMRMSPTRLSLDEDVPG